MRAFSCDVELSFTKNGIVSSRSSVIWVVRAASEEDAERKIYRHFKEYGIIGTYKSISSISFTEIFLHGDMDLEEYLESKGDSTVCVLF